MHAVLLHWRRTPAVNTTQAKLALLDVQLHKTLFYQVATVLAPGMLLLDASIQILYQVRDGAALHWSIALEGDSLAGGRIEDGEVADVGMVTALLRTDVWIILVLHVSLILTDES